MKIDRVLLSSNNNKLYYEFWNHVSKVYREKFDLIPTLIWVGTEEEKIKCEISEEYGEVIIVAPNKNYSVNSQCTLATYWATQFFPDEVCFICGIDEIALSGRFIKEMIKEFSDDDYLMLIADAYQNQHWSIQNSVSPSGYHVGKGKIFLDIYKFEKEFSETIEIVMSSKILQKYLESNRGGYHSENLNWGMDETYISQKLREYNGNYKIISLNNFKIMESTRIECFRIVETPYDMDKLRNGEYSHSHLCRPFSNHQDYILNMFNNIPKLI
jgi:hypothetical protein